MLGELQNALKLKKAAVLIVQISATFLNTKK
jgi:hypothetical protein